MCSKGQCPAAVGRDWWVLFETTPAWGVLGALVSVSLPLMGSVAQLGIIKCQLLRRGAIGRTFEWSIGRYHPRW